ncbi:MAG: hypothetical protein U0573_03040 [Phycisphaerales bacterium]|nr:hypothetical protein [Planctomycetota bacterium]
MTTPEKEILISRVVDGVAAPSDWVELDLIGAGDPSLWKDLAQAQRDRQLLDAAVGEAISVADLVSLPQADTHERRIRIPLWSGWAVAAMIALGAFILPGFRNALINNAPNVNQGSILVPPRVAEDPSPDDALKTYLDKGKDSGKVIRQLPEFVVLESSPAPDGHGYDVVYLRQIVERARVESLKSYEVDESGQKIPAPVKVIQPKPPA